MIDVVLIGGALAFRLLGALGVRRFGTWGAAVAHALALMLLLTASAHFVPAGVTAMPNHADLERMVPPMIPFPSAMVYLTGLLELAAAAGLVLAGTRRAAGLGLIVLFVLLLPANIHAALAEVPFHGDKATPLWVRIPEQALYISAAAYAAASATPLRLPQAIRARPRRAIKDV
jgi:uncharacterized membrane protein